MSDRETSARKGARRSALRRLVAGTALAVTSAVTSTAAMVAVTLPMNAQGDERAGKGTLAVADPGSTGTGQSPLSDDEIDRARAIALVTDRPLRTMSEDVRGQDGDPQFLTAAVPESADAGADERLVTLLFYDYGDDRTVKKTVDLTSGRVVETGSASGVQPPPAGPEAREALKVLLGSPVGDGVRQDFRAATGVPLLDDRKLRVQGLTYDTPPRHAEELADCAGAHRCVRLFTRVAGGPWIDTRQFVIDLSDRTAHRLP
ncbi:hypothetical protein [Streptomyces capitiformicae]|uniref:Tat pathway signal sequence domain protein n=1 Tax=Streptomyces capitiformicae TaxID=2014920 RepID=A0A919DNP9_9ACTN|nr:hypothetical protein [Streptomyces capitiformicae]GHE60973.1 hypothetical protein GCM10017771_84230 [Streptomyces capitiformicae]